jgi:aryl-alcohol dehydrogenase-like predicted oxidoreductase
MRGNDGSTRVRGSEGRDDRLQYAYLGNSGLVVSMLGFGAMTFATETGIPLAGLSRGDAKLVIKQCLDSGVNLFDSADVYCSGESETILGELLAKGRENVVIVTKGGSRAGQSANDVGLSARHLHWSIEQSLNRLGTDWIDVYLCHLPDARTPLEETLLALDQIVRSGKARYIGVSNWPAWMVAKAVALQRSNNLARFITGQFQYNLLEREVEVDLVPCSLDAGLGMMVYSPLASGVLSGKYLDKDPASVGGRLSPFPNAKDLSNENARAVVTELLAISAERDAPASAIALAWLARQPTVSTILMGINRVEQLEANLKAEDLILTDDELERLGRITRLQPRYPQALFDMIGDGWMDPRDRDRSPTYSEQGIWRPKAE